ncbi:MAG TPA: NAD(P)/FAD-dependent oxidoreductase [Solirubrobacteraceae bacterium]|nr:NAD(P)/FAD-dependent oxidoreductase [Solirubrobacteraceae bacterium]
MTAEAFDVAVVGASVAGCTAARLFAQGGARVALIERRSDPAAYKVVCTHAILPSATPTIERLGLAPLLVERGALRTDAVMWTPYGGWFGLPDDMPDGWGVTRRTLDPLLRDLAAGTPGVEYLPGWTARRVLADGSRTAGVEVEDRGRRARAIRARLVVAADGRDSTIARLAGVPGRVRPHNRFFYFAYWRGVRPAAPRLRLWLLDPDAAALFPNEDDLTVLVAGFHRSRLAEVRADVERSYLRAITGLPDAPDLSRAERVSKVLGKLEMPNVMRPAARPGGLAFAGDAALATDPLFGVGLSFAFQSAEWLVDETAGALAGGPELDRALGRYRRRFAWRLGPHHLQIADYATGRTLRPNEALFLRRAASDPVLARVLGEVLVRQRTPLRMMAPDVVARMLVPRRRR